MKKYWLIARNTWDEIVTYRLNFSIWRVRQVFQFLSVYFLWMAVIPSRASLGGYSHSAILTYVFLVTLLTSVVFTSKSIGVGDEITNGNLSNFLLRPVNYFRYWLARDVGDKAMNLAFGSVEMTILFVLLRPSFVWQRSLFYLSFFVVSVVLAIALFFFFQFLISSLAFWVYEVWSVRFLSMILLTFLSGGLFPLNLVGEPWYTIFRLLPFPYLLYFPVKVYLGQLPVVEVFGGVMIAGLWVFLLRALVGVVWSRGLREYAAVGR